MYFTERIGTSTTERWQGDTSADTRTLSVRNADGPSAGPLCPPDLDGMMPIALRGVEEEVLRVEQGGLGAHELLLLRE